MKRVGDVEWFARDTSNIFLLINFFLFCCLKGDLKEQEKKKNELQKKDIPVFPKTLYI